MIEDKKYYGMVPTKVREAAIEAIECGFNLEAVTEFNRIADNINNVSIYKVKDGVENKAD